MLLVYAVYEVNISSVKKRIIFFIMEVVCKNICRCCSDVVTGIIAKVMTARPKSKQLGIDILLMFIEIEKQDVVMVKIRIILPFICIITR